MTITKNKNKDTIYEVNKIDSIVTFEGHNYNINDNATARNLIYMLIDKCMQDDNLIDDYKHLLEVKEKNHKTCINTNNELKATIEIYKKEIERLNKKLEYLEKLDRKNFLQVLTLQNKI